MKPPAPRHNGGLHRRTVLASLAAPVMGGLLPRPARAALPPANYTRIATDFTGGVYFIDGTVRCSINPAGWVAFVASQIVYGTPTFTKAVFLGAAGSLSRLDTESRGYAVSAVQIGVDNRIAVAATRSTAGTTGQGVYRVAKLAITTVYEGLLPYSFGMPPPAQKRLVMSNDGTTLAFSSLLSGQGGLYRAGFTGAATQVRPGSGVFYNNRALGVVGASGAVAAEMEYGDPYGGLRRGALVFDSPRDSLGTIESTIERAGIGQVVSPALNGLGQMVFAVNNDVTIPYFSQPLGGGVPTTSLTVPAGVHVATPTTFGSPFTFSTVAAATDGYSNFGQVAINDAGVVVFEASAGSGRSGIFFGRDPVANVVAVTGQEMPLANEDHFFSIVRLGGLNNLGQVAFQTSDFRTTDQQIWRAQL